MIHGKRVASGDAALVVARNDYATNTAYARYDDADADLFSDAAFYAVVNTGAWYHAWKVLDNANGAVSTVQPSIASVDPEDQTHETSDGYLWKYLYSVPVADVERFATTDFFPVSTNSSVVSAAVNCSIEVVAVANAGGSYTNHLSGNNTWTAAQIALDGDYRRFDVSGNSSASSANDFYNGCYLRIRDGDGEGEYRLVEDYVVNSTAKTVVLASTLTDATVLSVWDIMPGVVVTGDGSQTTNAVARATINATGNSVHSVEILDRGEGYLSAVANVYSHPVVGPVTAAELRPIVSPRGGHGSDPASELSATRVCVSVTISNTESNTVSIENDFRIVGLLEAPLFSAVTIVTDGISGTFVGGETVRVVDPILLHGKAVVNSTSANATANASVDASPAFSDQFSAGDRVLLTSGTDRHLATVNSVTNSSHMVLTTNCLFAADSANVWLPRVGRSMEFVQSSGANVTVTDLNGPVSAGDVLIGVSSGARAVVNAVARGGALKGFDTFDQTTRYVGTLTVGAFQEDETVYVGNTTLANARFHSMAAGNASMRVTESMGASLVGGTAIGASSGARFAVASVVGPEIVPLSGNVTYVETIAAVSRSASQSERFKLIVAH